jgi:hypothetical protein
MELLNVRHFKLVSDLPAGRPVPGVKIGLVAR